MATTDFAPRAPFGAITTFRATNGLMNFVGAVVAWINERLEARRTAEALSRLSPEMLDDIGLTQADVAAYKARF